MDGAVSLLLVVVVVSVLGTCNSLFCSHIMAVLTHHGSVDTRRTSKFNEEAVCTGGREVI